MDGERLDKWLWAARFYKSRTLAAAACGGGKVDVNEQAAKPARLVRPGDLLHITRRDDRRIVRICSPTRKCFTKASPGHFAPRSERQLPAVYRPRGAGRPTKRERRLLERITRR